MKCFSTVPTNLSLKPSYLQGRYEVWSTEAISSGTRFGPYENIFVETTENEEGGLQWQVEGIETRMMLKDGCNERESNWLQFVNYTYSEEEQNMIAIRHKTKVYYITSKNIPANTELLVFCQDAIAEDTRQRKGYWRTDPALHHQMFAMASSSTSCVLSSEQIEALLVDSDSDSYSELEDFDESEYLGLYDNTTSDSDDDNSKSVTVETTSISASDWSDVTGNDTVPSRFVFKTTTVGAKCNLLPTNEEIDYFSLFFTDELIGELTKESNAYAKAKIQKSFATLPQYSIWRNFEDITEIEMKAFIGVILNMGLVVLPSIQDYWSMQSDRHVPFFSKVFTRQRFFQIFWMLHVPPLATSSIAPLTRGKKIQSIINYLQSKFQEHFVLGEKIAIDESRVSFKGCITFKTYNPQKPTKGDIRIFVLGDCATGFIHSMVPYYGWQTTNSLPRPDLPFGTRIVLKLIAHIANNQGHHLYIDRYYTSVKLGKELKKMKFHITGTIVANRKGNPSNIKKGNQIKLKKHEMKCYRSPDGLILLWKDKRIIFMYSTYHSSDTVEVSRIERGGIQNKIDKPNIIIDYTTNMCAIDRADHYCGSYRFMQKSLKWWRKLFFWVLEVAVVNAFILRNNILAKNGQKPVKHLQFRRQLIEQLVKDQNIQQPLRKRGRPSSMDKDERLDGRPHFIAHNPKNSTKDCAVCSRCRKGGKRRETVYFCETCSRRPGLHPGECFKNYHTKEVYKA